MAIHHLERPTLSAVVAANVRAEAARRGYSQIALGRALGMSRSAAHERWTGSTPWKLDELDGVAGVLGLTVAELVTPQAPAYREGLRVARPEGLEPPTFWSVVEQPVAPVIVLAEYRAQRDELKVAS